MPPQQNAVCTKMVFSEETEPCVICHRSSLRVWAAELNRGRKLVAKRLSSGEFSGCIEIDQLMFRHMSQASHFDEQISSGPNCPGEEVDSSFMAVSIA